MHNNQFCVSSDCKKEELITKIESSGFNYVFVEENGILKGVIHSDSLNKLDTEKGIQCLVKPFREFIPKDASEELISEVFSKSIYPVLPVLTDSGLLVDIVVCKNESRIPVLEPKLGGNELNYVTDCVNTNWISSQGKYVELFQESLGEYTGSDYVLAVSNGTVALHLALVCLGGGPGDEVIVPDLTFGATLNSVIHAGASPVIVDVNQNDWNIDPELIEAAITPKTKAIMPVHIYGVPCNMEKILEIAHKYDLVVIEDCAEALGAKIKKQHVGTFGDIGTFSFFGNKVITCGEGGALLFKSKKDFEHARILRDHGMNPSKRYWHDVVGFNYRITNLQAAVGVAQLEQLTEFRQTRNRMFDLYDSELLKTGYFARQKIQKENTQSYWLYSLSISDDLHIDRDTLIHQMSLLNIDVRPLFYPMAIMPAFKSSVTHLNGSSAMISSRGISLPSSVLLSETQIRYIASNLIKTITRLDQIKKL